MQDPHTPRDGFVDRLEWQISSELRRRQRSGPATWLPSSPLKAAAAIVFVVLASMAAGGAAVAAAVQAQRNEERDQIAAGYERRLDLARARLANANAKLQAVERDIAVGMRRPDDRSQARLEVSEADRTLRVLQLQLEEVRATGREPLSEISAPMVLGRDFVSSRLEADLAAARQTLAIEQERHLDVQARVKVGVAPQSEIVEIRARMTESEAAVTSLQRRLGIRREFLAGTISAEKAELRVLESDAELRLAALQPKITVARTKVTAAEQRFNVGLATQVDVAEARLRLLELEADLAKAQLDLALIRKKISEN